MVAAIRVENLWKIFGRNAEEAKRLSLQGKGRGEILRETASTIGVADVSFEVGDGELFVLMGLSGSGKSTLLRTINRLNSVTSGDVWIGDTNVTGLDLKALRRFRRKNVAMVFQHFALFPHRTVLENVALGLEIQGVPRRVRNEKALDALDMVQLTQWADKFPSGLSGGMRQRVGVARALAIEPEVLLMDEPFSALDPLIRSNMQDDLQRIRERLGKTIVFVTHDLDEALSLADRLAIMREGRIVQIGEPADITVRPEDDYVEKFVADVNRARVLKAADIMRPPVVRLKPDAHPKTAIRLMDEHGFESAFVKNADGSFAGVITMEQALLAARDRAPSIAKHVSEGLVVNPETTVETIISLVLEARRPVAVVGLDGQFAGVVRHKDLLPALSPADEPITVPTGVTASE